MVIKIAGCLGFPKFCRVCEERSDSCSERNMYDDEPPYIRFQEQLAEEYEEQKEDEDKVPFANLEKTDEEDPDLKYLNEELKKAEREVEILRDRIAYTKKEKEANPFKFVIGQTIFFIRNNKVYQGVIKSREVVESYGRDRVVYKFYEGAFNPVVYQDQAYATREELLASL